MFESYQNFNGAFSHTNLKFIDSTEFSVSVQKNEMKL